MADSSGRRTGSPPQPVGLRCWLIAFSSWPGLLAIRMATIAAERDNGLRNVVPEIVERTMSSLTTIPIIVTAEARQFLAEKGIQSLFEKTVQFAQQGEPRPRAIRADLTFNHSADCPCVMIELVIGGSLDHTEEVWTRFFHWRVESIPRESFFDLNIDVVPVS